MEDLIDLIIKNTKEEKRWTTSKEIEKWEEKNKEEKN